MSLKISLVLMLVALKTVVLGDNSTCIHMWDAGPSDTNICPVATKWVGTLCQFPFTRLGITFNTCTAQWGLAPQCLDTTGAWATCDVPMPAVIDKVTTVKGVFKRGASLNGGTLLWISGAGFAPAVSAFAPTIAQSNEVFLIGPLETTASASYSCEIHPDKTTRKQIACYTPPMPAGTYLVRVSCDGIFVPMYQYTNPANAQIIVSHAATPKLFEVIPDTALPESLVTINGNFKTACGAADNSINFDNSSCVLETTPVIKRVYFGGQICNIYDPVTNQLYGNLTENSTYCQLTRAEVNYYNATMLVNNDYGRSLFSPKKFFVAPNDTLYNYQTFAEIDAVGPQLGSTLGGTYVTINGLYFYNDINVPASIEIGGQPCKLASFNMLDLPNTTFVCSSPAQVTATEYYGNRGITVLVDNVYSSDLTQASPSGSATTSEATQASYSTSQSTDVTVWLKGFLSPQKDSDYDFTIQTNGNALLYLSTDSNSANKQSIATDSSKSSKIFLQANQKYFFMAVASRQGGGLNVSVIGRMYQTSLTDQYSSNVQNAAQVITISSTINPETYTIDSTNVVNSGGVSEEQYILITGDPFTAFTLQFDGVNTAQLAVGATAQDVQSALNDLPMLSPNLVTVSESFSMDGVSKIYAVQFCSDLGDVPDIQEVLGLVNYTITENLKGVASGKKIQLNIEGTSTNLFSYTNYTDSFSAFNQFFGIRCPASILGGDGVVQSNDYEYCAYDSTVVTTRAFCGRCSLVNMRVLVNSAQFISPAFRYVCFAYKTNAISLKSIQFITNAKVNSTTTIAYNFNPDFKWHYDCIDLFQLAPNLKSAGTLIKQVIVAYSTASSLYVDAITLRNSLPFKYFDGFLTTTRRVYPPVQINLNSLKVGLSGKTLAVSFQPVNCTSNLSLATINQNSGLVITRTQAASPAITGSFVLSWNNSLTPSISAQVSDNYLQVILQQQQNLGLVQIDRSQTCYGYKWSIDWATGGYKAPLIVSSSNLIGDSVSVSAQVIKEGYAVFNPIRDDMLRTYHTVPQVTVSVNTIMSKCAGNCDFHWDSSATPTVTSIDKSNLNSIILTGTGFDTNSQNNIVQLGGINCTCTATATQLTCAPGPNPFGDYHFSVNVLGKGLATLVDDPIVSFQLTATSIFPLSSGTGGGALLNVTGIGFNSNTRVTVDGNDCPVLSSSYSLITCLIPSNPTNTNKQVDVIVKQGSSTSTSPQQFTYDFTNTIVISSISPSVLSVLGGQNITITGQNLPLNPQNAKIGDTIVDVISSTSTSLVVQSPALTPGLYDFSLPTPGYGVALTNTKIEYKLYVSSFSPNLGSIRGGTLVTVNGEGFSTNCTQNQVNFGDSNCKVTACSDTWLQCQTSPANYDLEVDNSASDPYYGEGYAWSKPYLEINLGDTVYWSWKPPKGVNSVKYQVVQVQDGNSYTPIGFTSGSPTAVGSFKYQFNQAGTYYYWSGYVESSMQILFRGVVVVSSSVDKKLEIDVSLNGVKAQKCSFPFTYNSNSYSSCTNTDLSYNWCSPTSTYSGQSLKCDPINQAPVDSCSTSSLSSCNVVAPTSLYEMLFTNCQNQLPSIQNVSTDGPTFNSRITVTGTGFSTIDCENQVYVGGVLCPLVSSSTTQLVCELAQNCSSLQADQPYTVDVLVKNIGFSTYTSPFKVKFSKIVTSISPTIGSINGGTVITISGYGFSKSSTLVQIGSDQNIPYYYYYFNDQNNTMVTFNTITINTIPLAEGTYDIKVFNRPSTVPMEFLASAASNFTFSEAITPVLNSASPSNVFHSSIVTLDGNNFGTDTSALRVTIGTQQCEPLTVNNTEITCQLTGLNLGDQTVLLNVIGVGDSISPNPVIITGIDSISQISPDSGSIYGGQILTIEGNGFDNTTSVSIDNSNCKVISYSINQLKCLTGAHASASNLNILISTSGTSYNTSAFTYTYDSSLSPTITSVSPSASNTALQISGSGFGTDSSVARVSVGSSQCTITSITDSEIDCDLSLNGAGAYPVIVSITNNGVSNKDIQFTFDLTITSLSSTQGSVGGGLSLVIDGAGFTSNSTVTLCSKTCNVTKSSLTSITCLTPPAANTAADSNCVLTVSENGLTATQSFTYSISLTPKLSSVSPLRGGTGGGTPLTITGVNFPSDKSQVNVTIGGSVCDVQSISSTQIVCTTNGYSYSSVKALVQVFVLNNGFALNDGTVQFQYIDLWSSKWTWGGIAPPGEGELAVIGPGQTIYFDAATTPKLKGIIIQSGSLIFDDNQDVSLNVEYIIIVDGGLLQIGTKENPFQHKAVITMFGSLRSIELPIFGSKVIGVRNGTVDMHGMNVGVTWTYLGATSIAGAYTITLIEPVVWNVGSEIVITTTGDKFSPGQSEVKRIVGKSADNKTLTLNSQLKYTHLSEKRTVGTQKPVDIYVRAEVALLTRNVVFQGNNDDSWAPLLSAPACPSGFDPSEFAVQTCFLGRYGPELGTDQFGATIMLSGVMGQPGQPESVIGRFSNVELFHVGQAYRLGRYPIHFHMNGDMPSSYVSECAIHQSFNRATNIHASNYITVERTVIYDIMGGAFFLEDGIEIGNTFKNNLAIFVKTSSSSINEDVTPAAFWATNPNNTYVGNTVAGCSHFGFWYRLKDTPDGPSYTPNYHPNKVLMGKFDNNTVHSTGRFGLWIFPQYTPTSKGWTNKDLTPSLAVFSNFVAYSNDKGAEFDQSNNVQFKNMIIWDSYTTAIEAQTVFRNEDVNSYYRPFFFDPIKGPVVSDTIIIGSSTDPQNSYTQVGLLVPWDRGELISNVSFYNFPDATTPAIRPPIIHGRCSEFCGGWTTQFKSLYFENVAKRTLHRWDSDFVAQDLDGTLTGNPTGAVVTFRNRFTANNPQCTSNSNFANGMVCPTASYIRVAMTNRPNEPIFVTDERNNTNLGIVSCIRLTRQGNMMVLEAKHTYTLSYYVVDRTTANDIGYASEWYGFYPGDYLIMQHPLSGNKPDRVYILNGALATESNSSVSPTTSENGDWYWDNSTNTLQFIVINKETTVQDYRVMFSAEICKYPGCVTPNNSLPSTANKTSSRPADALYWSNISTWANITTPGWNSGVPPKDGGSVLIPAGRFVVIDAPLPKLDKFRIDGVVEFDNKLNHYLEANMLLINGGQLIIGWENNPILTNVTLNLTGDLTYKMQRRKRDANLMLQGFDAVNGKGIGVFGLLDIHGAPRKVVWTKLNQTLKAGTNTIQLIEPVDWQPNEEIVIGATSFQKLQSERIKIASVSSDKMTITLSANAQFDHLVYSETLPSGQTYYIAAPVGLISRNVKIVGGEYPNQQADQYGFNMQVSQYDYFDGTTYSTFTGSVSISNVQIIHLGNGKLDSMSCGHGIHFSSLGDTGSTSYFVNNSISDGYGCALSMDSTNNLLVQNNLFIHSGSAMIETQGQNNIIRRNLFISTKAASTNLFGESVIAEDNFLIGTPFIFRGDFCPDMLPSAKIFDPSLKHSIKRNTVYGEQVSTNGIDLMINIFNEWPCIRVTDFTIYKSPVVAIIHKGPNNLIIDNNIIIDSQVGIYASVLGPLTTTHEVGNKTSLIQSNLIVGQSPVYKCAEDPLIAVSFKNKDSIGAGPKYDAKIGVVWSQFMSSYSSLWTLGWSTITDYNAIAGLTVVNNVTFAYFDQNCKGSYDAIIATASNNDDGQHPVNVKNLNLYKVNNASKIWIHRPNIGTINPTQCVDMNCDGLKKELLTDLDGSLLGRPGTVIAQSEYEWGSQKRGLGDFRIPKEAVSYPNGSFLSPSKLYKYPGIVRDESLCTYQSNWQAYECHGLDHRMLIIESMDNDTEHRRLSPVAIISDNGYLDLINGPQFHAWCTGYICGLRVSTFMAIIAANHSFDVFLTAKPPTQLRFRVLNADSSFKALLTMYYYTSQRIDLYMNDSFANATNAVYVDGRMTIQDPSSNLTAFMPTVNSPVGTNLFYKGDSKMHFTIDGSAYIDLKIAPVLFVKFGFPAITPDQFFNSETLVGNMALLLGVSPSQIRKVNVVRQTSSGKKKRQSDQLVFIEVEIGSNPIKSASDSASANALQAQMANLTAKIQNQYLTGQLQATAASVLNVTMASMGLIPANASAQPDQIISVVKIAKIKVLQNAAQCHAKVPCFVQPILQVIGSDGNLLTSLSSWTIQAYLSNSTNPNATLMYQTKVTVVNGFANFTNLTISDSSDNFTISYKFLIPDGVNSSNFNSFNMTAQPISVIKPAFNCINDNPSIETTENGLFNLTFSLKDSSTLNPIPTLTWSNYTWQAAVSMYALGHYPAKGSLVTSFTSVAFDPSSGLTYFKGLSINKTGMYMLSISIYSKGREFNSQCYSNPITVSKSSNSSASASNKYQFTFSTSNLSAVSGSDDQNKMKASIYNYMNDLNISVSSLQLTASSARRRRDIGIVSVSGTIMIVFYSSNSGQTLSSVLSSMNINNYVVLTSATVNGVTVYGSTSGSSSSGSSDSVSSSISVGVIVGCVIGGIFLVIFVVLGYFGLKEYKKIQIKRVTSPDPAWTEKRPMSRPPSYVAFRANSAKSFNQAVNLENL